MLKTPHTLNEEKPLKFDWNSLDETEKHAIKLFLKSGSKLESYVESHFPLGINKERVSRREIVRRCAYFFDQPMIKLAVDQIRQRAITKAKITIEEIEDLEVSEITRLRQELADQNVNKTWVLKRAALLANFNIARFIKVDPVSKVACYDFSNATDDDWYCISEVVSDIASIKESSATGRAIPADTVRLKSYDKMKALKMVGDHVDVLAFKTIVEHQDKRPPDGARITGDMTPAEAAEVYSDMIQR